MTQIRIRTRQLLHDESIRRILPAGILGFLFLLVGTIPASAQTNDRGTDTRVERRSETEVYKKWVEVIDDNGYTYRSIMDGPFEARYYTLENGLTVILSPNAVEPRIQTLIAVRAGSKHDPAEATGLAHYLEHMLFKGTDRYGSKNWQAEERELAVIEALYSKYNKTTNPIERQQIYRAIDSVSGIAATHAIPNEYDRMVATIGASGTNAFTSTEQTVYVNDIPSNQVDRWLTIEAERFRNPVFRLFHTELEAVYETEDGDQKFCAIGDCGYTLTRDSKLPTTVDPALCTGLLPLDEPIGDREFKLRCYQSTDCFVPVQDARS